VSGKRKKKKGKAVIRYKQRKSQQDGG